MDKRALRLAPLAIGLLLLAPTVSFAVDNDMDGSDSSIDCNDNNPAIHPGATEVVGNEVDEDCDAHEICYVDGDGDGYRLTMTTLSTDVDCADAGEARITAPTGDCDDADPGANPSRFEECDAADRDEDCDGGADDLDAQQNAIGISSWYEDADSDAYGNSSAQTGACDAPSGHVAIGGDCDDTDDTIHPSATEVCDAGNTDEDCDGLADDLDSGGAADETTWYTDSDSDGYGDSSSSVTACDAPSGHIALGGDCDDTASSAHPGGTEVCDAADVDEDCDSTADDSDPEGATGRTTWYADSDSDGYGDASSSGTLACDAPSGHVGNDGDCDDTSDAISPGHGEVCDDGGTDDDCDGFVNCDDSGCGSEPACAGTVEVFDHFECFKIKTTEKLKATLDLDPGTSPPFQVAAGCTIGKAAKLCVPVKKTVAVVDASSTLTENPLYEGPPMETMNICYKVKCPSDSPPVSGTPVVEVMDRFGNREFEKFKVSELCTPAEIVP